MASDRDVDPFLNELTARMAGLLCRDRPNDVFREIDRISVCGQLTYHREPDRQALINATPPVTGPITRSEYASHLQNGDAR